MDVPYKNRIATHFFIALLAVLFPFKMAFAQTKDSKGGGYSIEGSTSMLSHFVHHGLSQTQRDPSLQTNIYIPLGSQFRVGLWGSNVSYEGSNNHIWAKILFDLKVEFNKDVELTLSYDLNQFYKDKTRNGNTTRFALNIMSYHVTYELESNWEGTETGAKRVGFGKSIKIYNSFDWDNEIGYTMVTVDNLQNFFDLRSKISSSYNRLDFHLAATATSNPSQFNGNGDMFIILGMGFKYQ